jgi:tRNA-binding EMAP/Myf-like protein
MKISYNWLRSYINLEITKEKTADILTSIGLEVEAQEPFESVKGSLRGLVVGEVLSCSPHPQADKLTLTKVDIGSAEPLSIVCGAPNVAAGQKVIVAPVGCTLYGSDEPLTIRIAKIRGEESFGMICAEDEIGMGKDHSGILVLDPSIPVGKDVATLFEIESDHIFEIGLTPNRIDSASHFGVARELKAALGSATNLSLSKPLAELPEKTGSLHISVEIANPEACIRYSGITIAQVKIAESPRWLKNRLKSIGMNPVNNVVDITNFVLHETGQPLHAFDAGLISGNKVIVKTLPEGTPFVTLDVQERKLNAGDLMICNENEGMCIAGVFGGLHSGVTQTTENIFLESACFNPVWVRKTSKRHQIYTDSSFRFERGTDPNATVYALKRAAAMICEITGGKIASDVVDIYPEPVDSPLGLSSGAADIFGTTGGVMEAAIRTVYELITGRELPMKELHVEPLVGLKQIKTADLQIENALEPYAFLNGVTVKVAVTSGLRGASKLMEEIRLGKSPYHFIEIMGCPGGCISGGGQPRPVDNKVRMKRLEAIYREDEGKSLRKSHLNEDIQTLYKEFLGHPLGHLSHELLHTTYVKREKNHLKNR